VDPASGAESPIGSLVAPDAAGTVRVHLVIKAAPWVDVSRARLLLPGGESVELPVGPTAADGVTRVDLTRRVRVPDGRDSWIAAEASGARSLYPVIIPYEVPSQLLTDAVNAVGAGLGLKDEFGNLRPKQITQTMPFALSNPIFVDGNGDGIWGRPRATRPTVGPQSKPASHQPRALDLRAMYRDWLGH